MKILYITSVWTKLEDANMHTAFIQEAARQGHQVTVAALCEKRNGQKTYFYESENGIRVLTVKCGNIQKTGKYEKVISSVFANFLLLSAVRRYIKDEIDLVVWPVSTTLLFYAVQFIVKIFHAKEYLLLKEYWPQDPVDLGALRENGLVYKALKWVEKTMLHAADFIGVSSPAGIRYVTERYPEEAKKCKVCPHCEAPREVSRSNRRELFAQYGIPEDKTVFIYGGNFGVSQGVEDMISCIRAVDNILDVHFVFLGSGTEYEYVKEKLEFQNNIQFLAGMPYSKFFPLASVCDCGLIFLFRGYHVPNIPGKLNTYLNAELPIIACTDSTTDAGDIIQKAGAGFRVSSGDTEAFKNAVQTLTNDSLRQNMSRNAKNLFLSSFTPDKVLNTIISHLPKEE